MTSWTEPTGCGTVATTYFGSDHVKISVSTALATGNDASVSRVNPFIL